MSYRRGSVYQRGGVWWISYYRDGVRCRESSGSETKQDAVALLDQRLAESRKDRESRTREQPTFKNLADELRRDYRLQGRKSTARMELSLRHLAEKFGGWDASEITARAVREYADERSQVAAPATVNRELSALKRMFRLGKKLDLVDSEPEIDLLNEDNARKGFFTESQLRDVLRELPEYLRPLVQVAYLTGWRRSELLSRKWQHVDFKAGWIRLEKGETKNGEGRQFPLIPQLRAVLQAQRERKERVEREPGRIISAVFFRDDGRPIRNFEYAWRSARKRAGHPEKLFHDFRRTAAQNLIRHGVARSTAKKLTGYLTDSVFERYAIEDEVSLAEAGRKYAAGMNGHKTVTATPKTEAR